MKVKQKQTDSELMLRVLKEVIADLRFEKNKQLKVIQLLYNNSEKSSVSSILKIVSNRFNAFFSHKSVDWQNLGETFSALRQGFEAAEGAQYLGWKPRALLFALQDSAIVQKFGFYLRKELYDRSIRNRLRGWKQNRKRYSKDWRNKP